MDLDEPDAAVYDAFITAVRDHVAVPHGDPVDTSPDFDGTGWVGMYRLRQTHTRDQADSMFVVRLVGSGSANPEARFSVDFHIQDTDLYGWGFTLTGRPDFYHLSNPPAGALAMAENERFTLHDTGILGGFRPGGLTRDLLSWDGLRDALAQLQAGPDLRDHQRPALSLLAEVVCEATRFRGIAALLGWGRWGAGGASTPVQRDRITELETNWSTLSGLFIQYDRAPGEPVEQTSLSRDFDSLAAIAAALTVLHVRPASHADASTIKNVVFPRPGLHPVLDAGGSQPDTGKAWFLRPGTCLTYDLTHDTVASGDPRPVTSVWPGLKGTDFPSRIDTVVCVPDSTAVWLFSGHRYIRYDTATDRIAGPREIADGWPALGTTSFVDYIDAAVLDPGNRTGGLFFFRDSEVLYYHLDTNTIDGPHPIAQHLYGLADTPFARGVSAALNVPDSTEELWLLRGEDCVRYNLRTHTVTAGPERIHADRPTLRRKTFVDGMSSILECHLADTDTDTDRDQVWMFRNDLCLRFSRDHNTVVQEPQAIGSVFPGLDEYGFADGIDAAVNIAPGWAFDTGQAWFFRGDQYLGYDLRDSRVNVPPAPIAEGWPGLKGTVFASGVDAAFHSMGNVVFFAGGQYAYYNLGWGRLWDPPKPIAKEWKALADTPFSRRIDTVIDDGYMEVWLFHGDVCLRYDHWDDKIVDGTERFMDNWNFGFPAP
ncbi:hemopexin repeat-containing protein [Streptomyces sp. NPDC059479]|uniref:hemopexin repeat-containing protein n=1 Tax=Streptomyces sp. NPDC059479 TaxID=3346848 RepID=UPI0036897793